MQVDRAALRLYGVSHGTRLEVGSPNTYEIPAAGALFVISGDSGFAVDIRLARNATPLILRKLDEHWVLDSFVVEHIHGANDEQVWRLTLPTTTWNDVTP